MVGAVEPGRGRTEAVFGIAYVLIVVLLSCYFTVLRFDFRLNPKMHDILYAILSNSGETPHQYRILVPWLANLLVANDPAPLHVLALIDACFLCLLAFAFRHYLSLLFAGRGWPTLLSLSLFYVLPFSLLLPRTMPFFPSDIPSILFFTLGLTFLYKRRMAPYYLLFALATMNRETTCFLTLAYVFTALGEAKPKTIAAHGVGQLLVWVAIKYLLYRVFADNPGDGLYGIRFGANLEALASAKGCLTLLSSMGFIWIPAFVYYRRIPDRFVRRSLLVVPPYVLGMFCVGYVLELRIYADLIPVVLTAFLLLVRQFVAPPQGGCSSVSWTQGHSRGAADE
jgi:hypothetical protein